MRYISTFSGIEAATVAWEPLGWEPICFSEIDEFPSAVLAHHYPNVPNMGDITKVDWGEVVRGSGRPDVVVGGSPCQSFSVAGGRDSLGGESRLMFEYIRACDEIRSPWIVWENVCGVLNTKDNAFRQLLDSLQDIGYVSLAWRVLDAQFFGVAQRRKRIFLVGHLGNDGCAAAVLFESESVRGNTQTSKRKREALARAAGRGSSTGGSVGFKYHQGSRARSIGYLEEQSPTLIADYHQPAVMMQTGHTSAMTPSDDAPLVVRRLMPVECERLQGFPDNWTDVPFKGSEHPTDTPRYKAIGNSMAVPVMRWIGERIEFVERVSSGLAESADES